MSPRRSCAVVLVLALVLVDACSSETTGPTAETAETAEAATSAATLPPTSRPAATLPAATALPGASTTQIDGAVARWTDDMRALGDGVRRIHPNPFWRQSEAAFDASLAAAPARLARLDEADARAEVMRLTSQIDGHSGVYLAEAGFHLYAIHLYDFDGQFVVISAADPALVGATVLRVGELPVAAAAKAVAAYSPFDNAETIKLVVPTLLTTPEVLHAAGVINSVEAPNYTVRRIDGTEQRIDPDRLSWDDVLATDPKPIGMTKIATVPALARVDEPFWSTVLDAGHTLYVQYNEVVHASGSTSMTEFAEAVDTTLDAGEVGRVVVDLRYNPGGDTDEYDPFLRVLTTNTTLRRPGALVVLIGRQTFSAAALFAAELDRRTTAVFVGEPTGGSPNLYANPRRLTLPNSGILVNVSSKYFEVGGPGDTRGTIAPDIAVAAGPDDLLAGRDPVLAAALALP